MAAQPVKPLIVITGPTASGKTSLAISLAEEFNGEIICADSRTVYKYMDIGTAKPTAADQARVAHWGIDLVEPGERFTAADFKSYADQKIAEIRARGRVPFLVGGTGLYVDSVIFNYTFGSDRNEVLRYELQQKTIEELHEYSQSKKIPLPENDKNKRYIIRKIENLTEVVESDKELIDNTIVVGIATEKDTLVRNIEKRAEQLFEDGVVEEAKNLGNKYGWDNEAMTSNIYRLIGQCERGDITIDELKQKFLTSDWRLAKRQMTWLRRNKFVQWMTIEQAKPYISGLLAKQ